MKKLSAFIICLLLVFTCALSGCAGFKIDKVKYYNEVLATVGSKNITRYDLLSSYNSFGESYFVDQLGQSESEALVSTLDTLIDRESLYQYATESSNEALYRPQEYQINEMIEDIFDSIDSQMETYVTTAKAILNITNSSEDEDEDETSPKTLDDYKYSKRATLVRKRIYYTDSTKKTLSPDNATTSYYKDIDVAEYVEGDNDYDAVIVFDLTDFNNPQIINKMIDTYFKNFKDSLSEEDKQTEIYNKCISLLAQDLIENEKYLLDENGNSYNTVTDDLIYRYFKRNYDAQLKSAYLNNIRTYYLKNELSNNLDITTELEERFSYLWTINYNSYNNWTSTYKSKLKDISTDGDSVLYHPELTDGTRFGYFIHCLIKTDTTQQNQLTALEAQYTAGSIDDAQYELAKATILNETKANARDLDEESENYGLVDTENDIDLATVIEEYKSIYNETNYNLKLEKFINFMFKYSEDDATLSAGMPYVVGSYDTSKDETYSTNSSMVEDFTNEAIKLMQTNVQGAMTNYDINDVCVTSYGIHFIMYLGDVDVNDVAHTGSTPNFYISTELDQLGDNLYEKVLNPLTGETYFDMLFDNLFPATSDEDTYTSNNGYTEEEDRILNISRQNHKVVKYTSKIEATTTSL